MKRGINFYEAFALCLFMLHATNTKFFGNVPGLFDPVFFLLLCYFMELLYVLPVVEAWKGKIRFFLWKQAVNLRAYFIRKKVESKFKKSLRK